eukprot:m.104764 g.104764  ORF g.104764 m.104764 type:complete len:277 (-) comp9113_c0_seq1:84-914(-)
MAPGTHGGQPTRELKPFENLALGISAGGIEVVLLQPMLYWKNASQQKLPFTLNPKIMYRGLGMSVANNSVAVGLQFPLTGFLTSMLTGGENRRLSDGELVASGFLGGFLSGVVCSPLELVMIQQQRTGMSFLAVPVKIAREYGLATMSRGFWTTAGREGLFAAGYLGIGPALARLCQERYNMDRKLANIAGAIPAGIIASTLSHPLDTIKTCMQGDVARTNFGSLLQTAKTLFADGGITRFYRGWGWRTSRMCCAVFILNETRSLIGPLLFPSAFA